MMSNRMVVVLCWPSSWSADHLELADRLEPATTNSNQLERLLNDRSIIDKFSMVNKSRVVEFPGWSTMMASTRLLLFLSIHHFFYIVDPEGACICALLLLLLNDPAKLFCIPDKFDRNFWQVFFVFPNNIGLFHENVVVFKGSMYVCSEFNFRRFLDWLFMLNRDNKICLAQGKYQEYCVDFFDGIYSA